ncbi:MAG: hypothetical protein UZ15_CFX003002453 [Chloroflexi bacterium OLB15]|nr:MAG: hypothetical protein UZ15_CFX003002453 [Chloroflexi bacterium OLB15]
MKTKTNWPPHNTRGMEQDDVQRKRCSPRPPAAARARTFGKTPASSARSAAPHAKPGSHKRMGARDQRISLIAKMKQNQLLSGVGAKSCMSLTKITCWFTNNGSVNCTAKLTASGWHATQGVGGGVNLAQARSRGSSASSYRDRSRSEYGGQRLEKAVSALPERYTNMSTGEQSSPNLSYSDLLRATFADIVYGGEGRA